MSKKGIVITILSVIVFAGIAAAFVMLLSKIDKLEDQVGDLKNGEKTVSEKNVVEEFTPTPSVKPTSEVKAEAKSYDLSELSVDEIAGEIDRLLSIDTEGLKPEEVAEAFPVKPQEGYGSGTSYRFVWTGADCVESVSYSSEFNMDGTLTKASKAKIEFAICNYEKAESVFRTLAAEYFIARNQKGFNFQSTCEGTTWQIVDTNTKNKSRDSLYLSKSGDIYQFSITRDNSTYIDPKTIYGDASRYDISLMSVDDIFDDIKKMVDPNLRGKNLDAFLAAPPISMKANRTDGQYYNDFDPNSKIPNLVYQYTFRESINDSIKYVTYSFSKDNQGSIVGNYTIGIDLKMYQFEKAAALFDLVLDEYYKDAIGVERYENGMIALRESHIEGYDENYTGSRSLDYLEVRPEKDEYSGKEVFTIRIRRSFCTE